VSQIKLIINFNNNDAKHLKIIIFLASV